MVDYLLIRQASREGLKQPDHPWAGIGTGGSDLLSQPDPRCSVRQERLGVTISGSLQLWGKQVVSSRG